TSWNTAANWSNQPGGAGGAGVPGTNDYAVFDSNSVQACIFDTNPSIYTLVIDGYAQTINMNSYDLTTQREMILASGAVTFTANGNVTIGTDYVQTAGTFTSSYNKTFTVGGSFSIPRTAGAFSRFSGSGTSGSPYMIYDIYGLEAINCYLNNGSVYFRLANSIDATNTVNWNSAAGFLPIGTSGSIFQGNFNGQGYVVVNLYINRPSESYAALFGYVYGTISNVGLVNLNITGGYQTAGLVGTLANWSTPATVTYCYVTGSILGSSMVAGLVANSYKGTISNSYSTANVTATSGTAGGLVGQSHTSSNTITDCYVTGNVSGLSQVGGLIGYASVTIIKNSFATGNVTGNASNNYVGP
ncbi:MAG: GLUG motif-containing protein, partial [Planctomycetota bacterium]